MPTTLRPSISTSPGPTPAKQICDDQAVRSSGPVCTVPVPSAVTPRLSQPARGTADVVVPSPVRAGDEDIDPQHLAGAHEHRAAAAVAPAHLEPFDLDVRLRAAEHERGPGRVEDPDRAVSGIGHRAGVELCG